MQDGGYDNSQGGLPDRRPFRFGLSTLFVVTTICAVCAAAMAEMGVAGFLGMVFFSWMGLVGGSCIYMGLRREFPGRTAMYLVGAAYLTLAVAMLVVLLGGLWES